MIEPATAKQIHHSNTHEEVRDKTIFGFWVYLMTDCLLFASLFATYVILRNNTAGGPGAEELFNLPFVLTETVILLTSSFTAGLAMLAVHKRNKQKVFVWLSATMALGLAFLGMELYEFAHLVHEGNSWERSGFLSAFFTLIGTHGLHITAGLVWIGTLMYLLKKRGFTSSITTKLMLASLFWHFLDIIWIFIFTIVYLMGVQNV